MADLSDTRVVELSNDEYFAAMVSGCMRRINARRNRRSNYHGRSPEGQEEIDLLGAVGEACVAKYLNKFWLGPGEFRGADVGDDLQVRTTSYKTGHLVLSDGDSPDARYILVYACDGVGHIRGWCYGREGQQGMYLTDKSGRGPAYYVPVSALHPIPPRRS
jgi:hypothetical protein